MMKTGELRPIFFDPDHRRWNWFRWTIKLVGYTLGGLLAVLGISFLIDPVLPQLTLAQFKLANSGHHPVKPEPIQPEIGSQKHKARVGESRTASPHPEPSPSQPVSLSQASQSNEVIGFLVNWDDTSFTSLKQNSGHLTKLIPEWLHLADADGNITQDEPQKQQQVLAFLRSHQPQIKVVPLINNFISEKMEWQDQTIARLLANPLARRRVIDQLVQYVQGNHFAGISVDFENIPDSSQANLMTFMSELFQTFHPLGLEVSQSVPLDDPNFDYQTLATVNDFLIVMAYDEHWSESDAGPVASQPWYTAAIARRFSSLPASKIVVAVGNYGYDWLGKSHQGTEISYQEAMQTAKESEGVVGLDHKSLNPTFDYYDDHDKLHHVWFLDSTTTFNQVTVAQKYSPHGFALWRLGSEDPSIWPVFDARAHLNQAVATATRVIHYGYDVNYDGEGEILKVISQPHDGARSIGYDEATGLISDEKVVDFASPYVIDRWGAQDQKKIAITFDDGPDPVYTPQILDILKASQVPATFFVIGGNAEEHPDLLRRLIAEGHEIGSHTFTHPNIAVISDQQLSIELNATQRLFESEIKRHTLLFRPPYAEDVEPENPEQVKPLVQVGSRGYYTVGMQIDPNDWRNPGVDSIVNGVLSQTEAGLGNIVLLHDSGGDRSQTVKALPKIIEALRAKGYSFVLVSDLMGVSRDAVMPSVPASEVVNVEVEKAGFSVVALAVKTMAGLFLVGIVLGVIRLVFVTVFAVRNRLTRSTTPEMVPDSLTLSVIIPAYNEEKVICQTVESLLNATWSRFDIIVVDDGSSDATYDRVVEKFGGHPNVKAFRVANGGKAAALNFGISQTRADVIVAVDADTMFHPDAIGKLARHFANPKIGAVAGNAKVGNRINLLTRWQALEYITSQNLDRKAYDTLNCISVVPGAIGAWRRELIIKAGGFTHQTLAEDADLTMAILRLGYRIVYEDQAIAYTEAPDSISAFLKQRFRWMFGTLQAVWKNRDAVFQPRYRALGMFVLPNVLIFQIFFPLISPLMDLMMVFAVVSTFWQRSQHPTDYSSDGLVRALAFYALFVAIDLMAAVTAFLLESREDFTLIRWLFLQRFFYRQLMYFVAIKSTLTAIRGSLVGWGKLERKATVNLAQ